MMRASIALLTLLLCACSVGTSYDDVNARSPRGIDIELRRVDGGSVRGEFLGTVADGVLVATPGGSVGRLVLIPYTSIQLFRAPGLSEIRNPRSAESILHARSRARYPHEIDDMLLQRLLAAYGQTELERGS